MIKRLLMGLGGGILGVVILAISTITTFAIPVLVILWVTHTGPFSKPVASPTTISFCSTLNEMTSYATSHPTPKTAQEYETAITYSNSKLSAVNSVPTQIQGTVEAALATSGQLVALLQTGISQGLSSGQQQQFRSLDRLYIREASTLNKWYQSNC